MPREKRGLEVPHTYVIIFFVVLLCWGLTFVVPVGRFETREVSYRDSEGREKTRQVVAPETFRLQYPIDRDKLAAALRDTDETRLIQNGVDMERLRRITATSPETWDLRALEKAGLGDDQIYRLYQHRVYQTDNPLRRHVGIWGTEDFHGTGVLNYLFEGLVTGNKWGSAVGIVAFILVIGGAFGIILRTGAIDAAIHASMGGIESVRHVIIPFLFFLFSLGGAIFGMSEECIPLAMVVIPFIIAMGYDATVGVVVTFVATQVGNAASWMNPFGVAIAQGIADVPVLSGAGFRIVMWVVLTGVSAAYITRYARRIQKDPVLSTAHPTDSSEGGRSGTRLGGTQGLTLGEALVLLSVAAGVGWIVWGVTTQGYGIPEIASQFFVMGLAGGVIGVLFRLNRMGINDIASSFQKGAADLVGAAMVVGMAKGILLVLGGDSPTTPTVLNTILSSAGSWFRELPGVVTAVLMYAFQTVFNFFVTSNSGQAALTMPILAPLSDMVGVSRQVAVLCYQLGSGFADAIVPTSASLMGVLGVAGLDWTTWARFQVRMQAMFFLFGTAFVVTAVMIGY